MFQRNSQVFFQTATDDIYVYLPHILQISSSSIYLGCCPLFIVMNYNSITSMSPQIMVSFWGIHLNWPYFSYFRLSSDWIIIISPDKMSIWVQLYTYIYFTHKEGVTPSAFAQGRGTESPKNHVGMGRPQWLAKKGGEPLTIPKLKV